MIRNKQSIPQGHSYSDPQSFLDPGSSLASIDPIARLAAAIIVRAILDLHNSKSSWLMVIDCLDFFLDPNGAELFLDVLGYRMDSFALLACVIRGDIVYAGSSYYLIRGDEGPLDLPEENIYGQTAGRSCA
jgi:hypothetical protein